MTLDELNTPEPYTPICEDSSVPRAFKPRTIYGNNGENLGEAYPSFDSSVLPSKDDLDLSNPVNLADPVNYAAIVQSNDSVDINIAPGADALNMAQYVNDQLKTE